MKFWTLLVSLVFSLQLLASELSAENFKKRFNLIRNTRGGIVRIEDKTLNLKNISLKDEIKRLRIFIMNTGDDLLEGKLDGQEEFVKTHMPEFEDGDTYFSKYRKKLKKFIKKLKSKGVIRALNGKEVAQVVAEFDKRFANISPSRFKTVAVLNDSSYFYKQNTVNSVMDFIFELSKDVLEDTFILGVITTVIDEFIDSVETAKIYHQNMLYQYLTQFKASELGLTESEKERALSSVMEAEIAWYKRGEHRNAVNNWQNFGVDRAKEMANKSQERFEKNREDYVSTEDMWINPIFANLERYTEEGTEPVIMNFLNKKSFWSSKPTLAFNYSDLNGVYNMRRYLKLIRLTFSVAPTFGVGPVVDFFNGKRYDRQVEREGALFAYFEMQGDEKMKKLILRQSLNALERHFQLK